MNDYIFIIGLLFCIYALTVVSLIASMNKKDREHTEERKDLLNRLMTKNTTEYIQVSNKGVKQIKPLTDGEILGDDRFDGILN